MANENVTPRPAGSAGQTLQPREYLSWLLGLEHKFGNLPGDTRAYLVSIDPVSNTRTLTPVPADASVISLETELANHLRDAMVSTAVLQEVRRVCGERLASRGIKAEPSDQEKRYACASLEEADQQLENLGRQVRAIGAAIQRLLPSEPHRHPLLTGDTDPQRLELRDGVAAARNLAITLDNLGCLVMDTLQLNEAMMALGLGQLSSFRVEAGHE